MSLPLRDFRGKISVESDVVLESLHRATGKEKSEIARDVLHEWACRQLEAASVMAKLSAVEGISRERQG
jgi:hypothetical protein